MKVVIPVADLHTGGGCKVLADVSNALVRKGHKVEMVIPVSGRIEYELHCKVKRVPVLKRRNIPYGDIVLPNFYTTFRPAFDAWPQKCVRFSLGYEPYWVPQKEEAIWSYSQGVPIITISNWLDEQIYQEVGQRSTVINLGVNPHVFFSNEPKTKNNPKIIMYIARNPNSGYKLKGFTDFVEAMKIVEEKCKENIIVHLICPEGELSLPDVPYKVFKPKTEQEMASLYRGADLFVSTSWIEGFSLPPLEAMACGTPVVTTNSGGVLDFCQHEQSAIITTPKDPHSIADGILQVLSNPSLAERLRKGGLEQAKRLTKDQFENKFVQTLENLHSQMN